jgi:hypothetical protein
MNILRNGLRDRGVWETNPRQIYKWRENLNPISDTCGFFSFLSAQFASLESNWGCLGFFGYTYTVMKMPMRKSKENKQLPLLVHLRSLYKSMVHKKRSLLVIK